MQNGFGERFKGRMRDEFLNEFLLRNLAHSRDLMAAWVTGYNADRPHSALGYQTPAGFALHLTQSLAKISSLTYRRDVPATGSRTGLVARITLNAPVPATSSTSRKAVFNAGS